MNGRKLAKFYSRGAERMSAQKYTARGRKAYARISCQRFGGRA